MTGEQTYPDIAWVYDFPTAQMQPIAGFAAFYNEMVDIFLDGVMLERPTTVFSRRIPATAATEAA